MVVPDTLTTWTAQFAVEFLVTVTADPGITLETRASQFVPEGTSLEIVARASDGVHETSWSSFGAGSYSGLGQRILVTPVEPIEQNASVATAIVTGAELRVSASDTDPNQQTAIAAGTGLRNLYLWATCANHGLAGLELGTSGTLPPLGFTNGDGVLSIGGPNDLLIAIGGCPSGDDINRLLGYWTVLDVPGSFCLSETASFGQQIAIADCDGVDPPLGVDPLVFGFSSDNLPACQSGYNGCVTGAAAQQVATITSPTRAPLEMSIAPSPTRRETSVSFFLGDREPVSVEVFDVSGRRVATLYDGPMVGSASLTWSGESQTGRPVAAGTYFVHLSTPTRSQTRKIVLTGGR